MKAMNYKPASQIHNALLYSCRLILSFQVRLLTIMKLDKSVEGTDITPIGKVNYLFKSRSKNSSTPNFILRNLFIKEV
jgi:hypothetical protein